MTSRDFAFWLQGLLELGQPKTLDEAQTAKIKQHLALVFKHEMGPECEHPALDATSPASSPGSPELRSLPPRELRDALERLGRLPHHWYEHNFQVPFGPYTLTC